MMDITLMPTALDVALRFLHLESGDQTAHPMRYQDDWPDDSAY